MRTYQRSVVRLTIVVAALLFSTSARAQEHQPAPESHPHSVVLNFFGSQQKWNDDIKTGAVAERARVMFDQYAEWTRSFELPGETTFHFGTWDSWSAYLEKLQTQSPDFAARVAMLPPQEVSGVQKLSPWEVVADYLTYGKTGNTNLRQQLALEAYLGWAVDVVIPEQKVQINNLTVTAYSQSAQAQIDLFTRIKENNRRTPGPKLDYVIEHGAVPLVDQKISVAVVAPAVGLRTLETALLSAPLFPETWRFTYFRTFDVATIFQQMAAKLGEIFRASPGQRRRLEALRARRLPRNVRVVEIGFGLGNQWFQRSSPFVRAYWHGGKHQIAGFQSNIDKHIGRQMFWNRVLHGEDPSVVESALLGGKTSPKIVFANGEISDWNKVINDAPLMIANDPALQAQLEEKGARAFKMAEAWELELRNRGDEEGARRVRVQLQEYEAKLRALKELHRKPNPGPIPGGPRPR